MDSQYKDGRRLAGFAGFLLIVIIAFLAWSEKKRRLDFEFFSNDTYFEIAGQTIILPSLFYTWQIKIKYTSEDTYQNDQRNMGENPAKPQIVRSMRVFVEIYRTFGERFSSQGICPILSREWARNICENKRPGQLKNLPQSFLLLNRDHIDILKRYPTVGKERQYDQIVEMRFEPGQSEIGCDKESKFCTAIVTIDPKLIAVWTVWSENDSPNSASNMAERQGRAIFQLVENGLGKIEDFSEIVKIDQ